MKNTISYKGLSMLRNYMISCALFFVVSCNTVPVSPAAENSVSNSDTATEKSLSTPVESSPAVEPLSSTASTSSIESTEAIPAEPKPVAEEPGPVTEELERMPGILATLPKDIFGFEYQNFHYYQEPLGFSIRYRHKKPILGVMDVYYYPRPEGLRDLSSREALVEVTRYALEDIETATEQGHWDSYDIHVTKGINFNDQFGTLTTITLMSDGIELHSILLVTEKAGSLVKIRMSLQRDQIDPSDPKWMDIIAVIHDHSFEYLSQH